MANWPQIVSELINLVAALVFIIYFALYLVKLRRLSETRRFEHLYPHRRKFFVILFMLINVVEVVLYVLLNVSDNSFFNTIEFYFMLGTCLNSLILGFELYILYVEIKKERPFNIIHRLYWCYLMCITFMRLVLEAYYQQLYDITVWELVLSSLLFADSITLFVYSWFMKRYEIQEFGEQATLQFNLLNETTRTQRAIGIENRINVETFRTSDSGVFPYLTVEIRPYSETEVMISTFSNEREVSKRVKSVDQLMEFYIQAEKLKISCSLNLQKYHIDIVSLQSFFDELMNNWKNYEPFVVQYLGVRDEIQNDINRCRCEYSQHSHSAILDPSCIYFDVSIPNIAKIIDHFEFDIIVRTVDHDNERTSHKRYTEFEDLDRRLRAIDYKGFKLRTPELPEKLYLNQDDSEKLEDRRLKLEVYVRRILNDKIFTKTHLQHKSLLFNFFRLDTEDFSMAQEAPLQLPFNEYSYTPIYISKEVTNSGEPVTFYYFDIKAKGDKVGYIRKRFRMFDEFNQELKRWMGNIQTEYKSIQLPSKIPRSSEHEKAKRHQDLADYLNILVKTIPNLGEFYQARKFLLSFEQSPREERSSNNSENILRKYSGNSLIESSYMSRMSQMIENLGLNSGTL